VRLVTAGTGIRRGVSSERFRRREMFSSFSATPTSAPPLAHSCTPLKPDHRHPQTPPSDFEVAREAAGLRGTP
jgi:hypothetical protein